MVIVCCICFVVIVVRFGFVELMECIICCNAGNDDVWYFCGCCGNSESDGIRDRGLMVLVLVRARIGCGNGGNVSGD